VMSADRSGRWGASPDTEPKPPAGTREA
jgi:hypothetical protein